MTHQKLRINLPLLLAIGGFITDLVIFYPGFMSSDTLDQYNQAVTGHYEDWHPPLMAWLWSFLIKIHPGPLMMLLFQLGLLWCSFYLLTSTYFKKPVTLVTLLFLFFLAPYIQNFAGYIIKDVQMAFCWLLAIAVMLQAQYHQRQLNPVASICVLLLIAYGTLIRINALPGAIPLCLLWCNTRFRDKRLLVKGGMVAAMLAGIFVLNVVINHLIIRPEKTYPEYKLFAHDLAGIYVKTGTSYFPGFITRHEGFDPDYIREHFTTATFDNIWWNKDSIDILPAMNEDNRKLLIHAWQKAIRENPAAYISNHLDGWLYYLQLKTRPGHHLVYHYYRIDHNKYAIELPENELRTAFKNLIERQRNMPFLKPWFWLLLTVVQLVVLTRIKKSPIKTTGLVLCLSALLYYLPQFFIFQIDTEFRYFYWGCVTNALCICLLIYHYLYLRNQHSVAA